MNIHILMLRSQRIVKDTQNFSDRHKISFPTSDRTSQPSHTVKAIALLNQVVL
ncbi:hypothetical protein H6G33_35240 [Calothrix sp. FACHB-1219]|uniref:hypothetical protein n=1 Tax=unclassified Calothrix TaxID=2619626 RepID=UPI0016880D2F|nr:MULTISPECIES: hypothetical protein [unclassified Calothrix]MBD2207589.1 hypothetical protein [Calothrix sp. FACHB-168]MBD2222190.1 hypothetical protein [Calothrix sp. FACHB-1219]